MVKYYKGYSKNQPPKEKKRNFYHVFGIFFIFAKLTVPPPSRCFCPKLNYIFLLVLMATPSHLFDKCPKLFYIFFLRASLIKQSTIFYDVPSVFPARTCSCFMTQVFHLILVRAVSMLVLRPVTSPAKGERRLSRRKISSLCWSPPRLWKSSTGSTVSMARPPLTSARPPP